MFNIKTLIIASIALIVILIAYNNFFKSDSVIKFKTTTVKNGNIIHSIKTTATLNPTKQAYIYSDISGKIEKINVNTNDPVISGQILAVIDSSVFSARYKQAKARVDKTEEDLKLSEEDFNVNKRLYEKRLISKQEFDVSRSAYRSVLLSNKEAIANLEQAKTDLSKTDIKSNINGIVLEKNIIIGQQLNPDNSKPLFILVEDLKQLHLTSDLSEADIGKVKKGQKVKFRVDAFPLDTYYGEIAEISNSPKVNDNVVTYDVISIVENNNLNLKPGMTAEVEILISDKRNIIKIPTSALRFIPPEPYKDKFESNDTKVWIVKKNKLVPIYIKTGISDDIYTEIIEGDISVGQKIVVESYSKEQKSNGIITLPQPKRY